MRRNRLKLPGSSHAGRMRGNASGGDVRPNYDPTRSSLVGRLVHAAVKGTKPDLEGIRFGSIYADDGGDQCYIKDAARGIALLQTADKISQPVYNISSGHPTSNQAVSWMPSGRSFPTSRLNCRPGICPALLKTSGTLTLANSVKIPAISHNLLSRLASRTTSTGCGLGTSDSITAVHIHSALLNTYIHAQLIQERTREANRVQKVLEDANIKLASVASNVLGVSGRQMLEQLLAGQEDPVQLAQLARVECAKRSMNSSAP